MPLDPVAPFLFDGTPITNAAGDHLGLLNRPGLQISFRPTTSARETAANTLAVSYQLGMVGGLNGPTGAAMPIFAATIPYADANMMKTAQRKVWRPAASHDLAVKSDFTVHFDGGTNPIQTAGVTEFFLDRWILADGYTESGGLGSNVGSAAQSLLIQRLDTAAALTQIYKRGFDITNNAALNAADTVVLALKDGFGVALTATLTEDGVGVPPAWAIGGTAAATATSIAAAINGSSVAALVSATAVGDEVRITKIAAAAVVLNLTPTPAGMAVMPGTGEVAIDIDATNPYAWRGLKTGDAMPDIAGVLMVQGWFDFPVRATLGPFGYTVRGDNHNSYGLVCEHVGLGLP